MPKSLYVLPALARSTVGLLCKYWRNCSLVLFVWKITQGVRVIICKQPLQRSSLPKNAILCELHMDNLFHRIIHSCYSVNTLSARNDSRIVAHDCNQLLRRSTTYPRTQFRVICKWGTLLCCTEAMDSCLLRSPIKTWFISTSACLLCQKDLAKDPCHDKSEVGIPWPHSCSWCKAKNPLVLHSYICAHNQPLNFPSIWVLPLTDLFGSRRKFSSI